MTAPAKLLVVDDEPEIAESLADFLRNREEYDVALAYDGQQAIDYLAKTAVTSHKIDLIVLDMRMPGVSGLEVLNWIRDHPELKYTRVVLLTAATGSQEKIQALSAGADDYITKPYYPQELLARVKTILRTQQLEKQLQKQSQQLAALNKVGRAVSATLDSRAVLQTAVDGALSVSGSRAVAILMRESGQLRYRGWQQQPKRTHALPAEPVSLDRGIVSIVFREQTAVSLHTVPTDDRFISGHDCPPNYDVTAMMAVPLIVRGRSVGVLCAYNPVSSKFSEADLDLFVSLARSASEAIENAWLFQRIRLRQQELLESRNTLQALIDGIPDPIYTINDNWQIVSVNASKASELKDGGDAQGQLCYQLFFDRDAPCDHCLAAQTLLAKSAQKWTVRWFGDDHLPQEWAVSAYPIPTAKASDARAVIVWQDRTEERRLEASLLQAGKLAAIGQLAAGVAHEINNPLTAVNANAEMLKMFIPPEDENREAVDLILMAGERATKVVRNLLDFARQEQYVFKAGDLNESIIGVLDLVRYQLQTGQVEMTLNLAEDIPPIVASWEHLKSVWLNLLVNAKDATLDLTGSRQIEITTTCRTAENTAVVVVRDNGSGMTEAEAVHIFEPFYTTKDPGKGTGLGLATSHRIIEQHKGDIQVASEPGQGATFMVWLPINRQPTPNQTGPTTVETE